MPITTANLLLSDSITVYKFSWHKALAPRNFSNNLRTVILKVHIPISNLNAHIFSLDKKFLTLAVLKVNPKTPIFRKQIFLSFLTSTRCKLVNSGLSYTIDIPKKAC